MTSSLGLVNLKYTYLPNVIGSEHLTICKKFLFKKKYQNYIEFKFGNYHAQPWLAAIIEYFSVQTRHD